MNENKHVQPEASAEDQLDQSLTQFPAEPEAEPATQEAEDLIQHTSAARRSGQSTMGLWPQFS